jgi:hypothetical protein
VHSKGGAFCAMRDKITEKANRLGYTVNIPQDKSEIETRDKKEIDITQMK